MSLVAFDERILRVLVEMDLVKGLPGEIEIMIGEVYFCQRLRLLEGSLQRSELSPDGPFEGGLCFYEEVGFTLILLC